MEFNTENLRKLPDDFGLEIKHSQSLTLITVTKEGAVNFASDTNAKEALVENYHYGDLLVMVWAGKWRSDAFVVTSVELEKYWVDKKSEELRAQAQKSKEEAKEHRKVRRSQASATRSSRISHKIKN